MNNRSSFLWRLLNRLPCPLCPPSRCPTVLPPPPACRRSCVHLPRSHLGELALRYFSVHSLSRLDCIDFYAGWRQLLRPHCAHLRPDWPRLGLAIGLNECVEPHPRRLTADDDNNDDDRVVKTSLIPKKQRDLWPRKSLKSTRFVYSTEIA